MIYSLLWLAYFFYVGCFIPQILTNIRRGSTDGMSNVTIFLYFFGYLVEIPYVYFLDMPLSCKVMIPVGTAIAATLALQRFHYESIPLYALMFYGSGLLFVLSMSVAGVWHPYVVGHLCGWIGSTVWLSYQLPQIYKVFRTKSVKGFNPAFMIIASIGAAIEVVAAVIIPLPPQALFNGARGILTNVFFAGQFIAYRA